MRNDSAPLWLQKKDAVKAQCSDSLYDWLMTQGSMTERLLEATAQTLEVQLLGQSWQNVKDGELNLLGYQDHTTALVRESLLCGYGKPWIYARSVFPKRLFTHEEANLEQRLDKTPIGKILYQHPNMRRSEVEVAQLTQHHEDYQKAILFSQNKLGSLWARRVVFYLNQKPLLVNEIFLPEVEGQ